MTSSGWEKRALSTGGMVSGVPVGLSSLLHMGERAAAMQVARKRDLLDFITGWRLADEAGLPSRTTHIKSMVDPIGF